MLIEDLRDPKSDKALSKNQHNSNQTFWELMEEKINPNYQTEEEMFQLPGMLGQL